MDKKGKRNFGALHDKYYKSLLLVPILLLIFSLGYMWNFYSVNNDVIYKDVSLTGGTSVTLLAQLDLDKLTADLSPKLEDFRARDVYDIITQEHKAIIIETKTSSEETKQILEDYLGYKLTNDNSSVEFTGSTLSESFYNQLLVAILFAFFFMAIVVFIIFRSFVPSGAVIISAFADILMTLVTVNILGIKMSSAGIIAFLMLIGYSVDTDILLTTRVLKRHGNLNDRIWSAFKTGITMTLTSFGAIAIALLVVRSFSEILTQIFTILVIGLIFDMLNTWITNVSLLKWYVSKK